MSVSSDAFNSVLYFSQAYNAFIEKNGPEQVLPELNMTSKELFFIGYAQVNNAKLNLIDLHCVSLIVKAVRWTFQLCFLAGIR